VGVGVCVLARTFSEFLARKVFETVLTTDVRREPIERQSNANCTVISLLLLCLTVLKDTAQDVCVSIVQSC
jgi:hypothetical protein